MTHRHGPSNASSTMGRPRQRNPTTVEDRRWRTMFEGLSSKTGRQGPNLSCHEKLRRTRPSAPTMSRPCNSQRCQLRTCQRLKDSAEEIAHAGQPQMRLLHIPHKAADFPLRNSDTSWTACSPETAATFSAVAYFFGRELSAREHVPIGLIDATWGGTVAEAWLSLGAISADAALMPVFATRAHMTQTQGEMAAILAKERREDLAARQAGQGPPKHTWHPDPASWAPAEAHLAS